MITLFGIKNCDSVKKACKWLDAHGINYTFHDFRVQGINEDIINDWLKQLPLEQLINKRSTTWKALSDTCKNSLNEENAAALCTQHETLIKRPVLCTNGKIYCGFDEKFYSQLFTA